jgi:DNA-binding NarL/FixJ family response regulator
MVVTRILVVDDFPEWRRFVRVMLEAQEDLEIIAEAADGMEAVQKVQELHPDLILLDVGLPRLNGLDAARQIRKLSPNARILFCSQESSVDIVEEARKLGARGYLVKSDGSQLLHAVKAVLHEKQFVVSRNLAHPAISTPLDRQPEDHPPSEEPLPRPARKRETGHVHELVSYRSSDSFVDSFARFAEAALKIGNPVIVLATEAHRTSLHRRLQAGESDIAAAIQQGTYVSIDAEETLSTFMVNDWPDPARFFKVAGDLITETAKAAKGTRVRVAACGECAPILWAQGKPYAAIQLERLWDEVGMRYDIDILCGYQLNDFRRRENSYVFERICAEHTAVYSL